MAAPGALGDRGQTNQNRPGSPGTSGEALQGVGQQTAQQIAGRREARRALEYLQLVSLGLEIGGQARDDLAGPGIADKLGGLRSDDRHSKMGVSRHTFLLWFGDGVSNQHHTTRARMSVQHRLSRYTISVMFALMPLPGSPDPSRKACLPTLPRSRACLWPGYVLLRYDSISWLAQGMTGQGCGATGILCGGSGGRQATRRGARGAE